MSLVLVTAIRRFSLWSCGLFLGLLVASPTLAQQNDEPASDWQVQVGVVGLFDPAYEGSDDFRLQGLPIADITYRDRFFLNIQNGLGGYIINSEDIRLGVGVFYIAGRDEDRSDDLIGMGDIDGGVDLNLFAEVSLGAITLSGKVSHQVTGDDTGVRAELGGSYGMALSEKLMLSTGVSATYASGEYMELFFGVTPQQAVTSGYAAYTADAGIQKVSLDLSAIYMLSERWTLWGIASLGYMVGDAADSPLTREELQPGVGMAILYSF